MGNASNGNFIWHEHMARDPNAAISFYTEVVGWKTQPFAEADHYVMWVGSQGPLGGVMTLPDEATKVGMPPHWVGHVQVQDVDATAALAKQLGGKVYKEPSDIPTVGRFAIIGDPQGAWIGAFTPSPMTLHDPSEEGEFCWNELLTSDSAAAFEFYSKLFGWKIDQEMDMGPMGIYRIFGIAGADPFGGMMTTPNGALMPPMWLYYTQTSNLDAALSRATQKGAKLLNGPMEVRGGSRIVQLMDSHGAAFALHEKKK